MPISFSVEQVRNYLLENGYVYTFREYDRSRGITWMNAGRNMPKICDVFVGFVRTINNLEELEPYIIYSSFRSVDEWVHQIHKFGIKKIEGYLYLVIRVEILK